MMSEIFLEKQKKNRKKILIMKRRISLRGKSITSNNGERMVSKSGQLRGSLILCETYSRMEPLSGLLRLLRPECEPLFKCEGGDHAKEKSESPEIKYDVSLLATCYVTF